MGKAPQIGDFVLKAVDVERQLNMEGKPYAMRSDKAILKIAMEVMNGCQNNSNVFAAIS